MNNVYVLADKFLDTVVTMAVVSDDIVEIEGEETAAQMAKPALMLSAMRKVEDVYSDRKTCTVHREPKIKLGYLGGDEGYIRGEKLRYYAVMKSDVYEAE